MSKKVRNGLSLLLVLVFLTSTALLIRHRADTARGADTYDDALKLAATPKEETPPTEGPAQPRSDGETAPQNHERKTYWTTAPVEGDIYMEDLVQINLKALQETNPDVVGWIFIPNTVINYPVLQGEDNQYYLRHTWLGEWNAMGSIFLESTNSPDMKDFRSIIYGHNMENGTMFNALHRYTEEDYWAEYPYVYLVTDEGVFRYEIYSCYRAGIKSDTYELYLEEAEDKRDFIQLTLDESELETDIVPLETDRILTLSTCVWHGEYRRVVHARLPMIEVEE